MIFTISINLLVAISADRYWAVCQPISYHVLKSSGYKKWIIAGCVVIGMVIVSPPILGWKKGCFSKGCFYDKTYAKMFDHLDYWIYWTCCATAAIITLYGLIFKSISDRVSKFYFGVREIFHNNSVPSLNDATIKRLMNQIMKAVRLKRELLSQWGSSLAVFSSAGCLWWFTSSTSKTRKDLTIMTLIGRVMRCGQRVWTHRLIHWFLLCECRTLEMLRGSFSEFRGELTPKSRQILELLFKRHLINLDVIFMSKCVIVSVHKMFTFRYISQSINFSSSSKDSNLRVFM